MRNRRWGYALKTAVTSAVFAGAYAIITASGTSAVAALAPLPAPSPTPSGLSVQSVQSGTSDGSAVEVIRSEGPLTAIRIDPDLTCSVLHIGSKVGEFFGDTACGTFVAISGAVVYGPREIPGADVVARGGWIAQKQTLTGDGTRLNPYEITTTAEGDSGFRIVEVDSYVVGDDSYHSLITLSTAIDETIPATVFHAGECLLNGADFGIVSHAPATDAVACDPAPDSGATRGHVQFIPISGQSDYFAGTASDLWGTIRAAQPLPDEVSGKSPIAHPAIGLSWLVTLAPGKPVRVSFRTNFAGDVASASPAPAPTRAQSAPAPPPAPSPAQSVPAVLPAIRPATDATPWVWGGTAAALVLFAGGSGVAANTPHRRQRRLVHRHVRLDPHPATELSFPPHHDPGLPAPTFRLDCRADVWSHRTIEEES